jgi:hypothetical protein
VSDPVPALFEQLDFVYMPSADVAADIERFTDVLGAGLTFAIEAFGTRVAMLELTETGPALLLAGHLEGEAPILVYRVADLDRAVAQLTERGWDPGPRSGIPHGPLHSFRSPGGQRLAIYELTRPGAADRLAGRRDF